MAMSRLTPMLNVSDVERSVDFCRRTWANAIHEIPTFGKA